MSFITFLDQPSARVAARRRKEEAASTICISEHTFFAPLRRPDLRGELEWLCFSPGPGYVFVLGWVGSRYGRGTAHRVVARHVYKRGRGVVFSNISL